MSIAIFDERTPYADYVEIVNSDGTNYKNLTLSDASIRRIDSILVSSDDTVDRYVRLNVYDGSTQRSMGYAKIPAGSGHGGLPTVDLVTVLCSSLIAGVVPGPFNQLTVNSDTAVTSGKTIQCSAFGGVL